MGVLYEDLRGKESRRKVQRFAAEEDDRQRRAMREVTDVPVTKRPKVQVPRIQFDSNLMSYSS
jgi:hypothetical protein